MGAILSRLGCVEWETSEGYPERNRVRIPEGHVVLTGVFFHCTGCGELKPGEQFGELRCVRSPSGALTWRNQPQCKKCRGRSKL